MEDQFMPMKMSARLSNVKVKVMPEKMPKTKMKK